MKPRNLKIEAAGDYWRGTVTPKIRLAGQWLERAGFKPGNRVEIRMAEQGTLTLHFVGQSIETSDDGKQSVLPFRRLKVEQKWNR